MENTINERIKILRDQLGLSQETFGVKVGMSRSEIKNVEYRKTTLKENKIPLICAYYGVNETWLRTGEGEMFVQPTRDEEIAAFVGAALSGEDENFRRRLLSVLSRLDEKEWQILEKMAKKLAGE